MVSRTRIAAAACLLASGLLATGSGASLAFANPDSGSPGADGGTGTGTGTGSTPGTGSSQPTGTPGSQEPTGTSPSPSSGSIGPWGSIFRPPTTVGNGRTGFDFRIPVIGSLVPTVTRPTTTPTSKAASAPASPSASAPPHSSSAPTAAAPSATGQQTAGAEGAVDPGDIGTGAEDPTPTAAPPAAASWPFSWWNGSPATAPGTGGGAGSNSGGIIVQQPISSLPYASSVLQLPQQALTQLFAPGQAIPGFAAITDPIVEVVAGLSTAASQLPFLSVTLPVIVVPPGTDAGTTPVVGRGRTAPASPGVTVPTDALPTVTPGTTAPVENTPSQEPQKTPPPATAVSNELLAAPTYRMGYVDYLRAAGLGEVAAVAVPGVTGILVLTGAGGLIGFRQARAGRAVRAGGTARFMG